MLQALLIWGVFATFLPPTTSQGCLNASESQCNDADFVPGSNLAGEGFDITTMERKGAFVIDMSSWLKKDRTCTLCKNRYMRGKKQKLPASVVDWRSSKKCSIKVSSSVYDSKNQKDKFSFTSQIVKCGYYKYRVSNRPVLHPELSEDFKSLPQRYDKSTKHLYFKLIDMFGTHYITKVTLGGEIRSVTSIKECQASLQGLSVDEVKSCLDLEASVSMGIAFNMQNEAHHCKQDKEKSLNKKSFSSNFSDRETNVFGGNTENVDLLFSSNTDPEAYKEWVSSLPAHPDVLSYSLMPLHDLLPRKSSIRTHLRNAIKDYILQRALVHNCTSPCKTGVKTNPKEPCSCSCHNNPGVALNCCPTQKGFAHVTVTIIKATGLYGDYINQTDGYVKILLNGKFPRGKTSIIPNNNNPIWNSDFHLETVDLSQFGSVKLEVWDEDSWTDEDLLGGCSVPLKSGTNENVCNLNHGLLYYNVQVNCITGLTGSSCMEYKPSPMDAQLKKVYISRNAYPIPRDMLLEIGVLLDERIPRFNMSNIRKAEGLHL
ncbi:hypothetical protein HF521_004227 [Silurus meridionalis]|uniref:Perforin-1-like n=1 Tax=Silurus meridionalis TaxID=175797 RepID=A0A8T0B097_SILME|nr:hypothetical protein HF521_004227 [Silurus meridionalis]